MMKPLSWMTSEGRGLRVERDHVTSCRPIRARAYIGGNTADSFEILKLNTSSTYTSIVSKFNILHSVINDVTSVQLKCRAASLQ